MMNKKGFISTTLIYSFFIVFLLLMLYLINSYSQNRYLLNRYRDQIKSEFVESTNYDINLYYMRWNSTTMEYDKVSSYPSPYYFPYKPNISYCKNGSTITNTGSSIRIYATTKDICYAYFGG